jgi:hypothetical protein
MPAGCSQARIAARAQQVRIAQGVCAFQQPIGGQAVVHQHAFEVDQHTVLFNGVHAAFGMHAVPGQRLGHGRVQPLQFARHAQTRLIRVHGA